MRLAPGGGEPRHLRGVEEVDQAPRLALLRALAHHHPRRHLPAPNVAGAPAAKQLRSPTCCACSYFCSRLQLCRVRYYCTPIYLYSLLTIRISRRPTVIDKRRFLVRLFSASTHCAHTRCACSPLFSLSPPLCSVRF